MIIDGKAIADKKAEELKKRIQGLPGKPKLAIVLVGDDPQSRIYVDLKVKKAKELGIDVEVRQDLDTDADGIIVQLPGGENLIDQIPPEKDVDGLTGRSKYLPATLKGILEVINPQNQVVVVVGQGPFGKPIADYFSQTNKVIRCDEFTPDLKGQTLQADILISAVGKNNLITADMVKPGSTVIDVGKDVDFENVKNVAGKITPPTGGTGPLTVISLLDNVVTAALNR